MGSGRFLPYNEDMQIPYVGGAMVPYGENSLLYVGGRGSDKIYQFDGKEMRAKVFRHLAWFRFRSPYSNQVNRNGFKRYQSSQYWLFKGIPRGIGNEPMPQGVFPLTAVNEACLEGWDIKTGSTTPTIPTATTNKTPSAIATTDTTTSTTPTTTTTIVATTSNAVALARPNWLIMVVLSVLVLGLAK